MSMASRRFLGLYLAPTLLAAILVSKSNAFPVGDVRNCPASMQPSDPTKPLLRIDAMPGMGFDNLRNLVIGQVYQHNYSTCKISEDGIYLLPDSVFLVPIQNTELDLYSQYFEHFDNHTSETSNSINVEAKYGKVSGKFSGEFQNSKMEMVNSKAASTRATVRHVLYKVGIQPDAQLNLRFKSRILDLVVYIQSNETKLAHYLADLLVLDYGTHVITHIDAGASLSQTTMLSKDMISTESLTRSQITASASESFFGNVKSSFSHSSTSTNMEAFNSATTNKHITTHGGPPFHLGNFTIHDWEAGVLDHLVIIDRTGQFLWTALTTSNMPEISASTLQQVVDHLYMAVDRYYKINTHPGCTNPDSANFNYRANVEDRSCEQDSNIFKFGGVYQTCNAENNDYSLCDSLKQTNPLTGDASCPVGYSPIPLHSGTQSLKHTFSSCWHNFFTGTHCNNDDRYFISRYHAFWCALNQSNTNVSSDSGFMFGGLFTPTQHNPITQASNCPPHYIPLHILSEASICVSADARGAPYQVQFGGMYSCDNGNGLASTAEQFNMKVYPQSCPHHYDRLLATVDENCQISYCTSLKTILEYRPAPPRLPPYSRKPVKASNVTDILFVVRGANGRSYWKDEDGNWVEYSGNIATNYFEVYVNLLNVSDITPASASMGPESPSSTPNPTDPSKNGISPSYTAGVILGSILGSVILSSVISAIFFGINWSLRKRNVSVKEEAVSLHIDAERTDNSGV